jgi:hypothetical protein
VRSERTIVAKKAPNPVAKPWVHLTDVQKPFDQTNGAIDFDVEDPHDDTDTTRDLLEKGVVGNIINVSGGI